MLHHIIAGIVTGLFIGATLGIVVPSILFFPKVSQNKLNLLIDKLPTYAQSPIALILIISLIYCVFPISGAIIGLIIYMTTLYETIIPLKLLIIILLSLLPIIWIYPTKKFNNTLFKIIAWSLAILIFICFNSLYTAIIP
tara:strand:- start:232 stop:651 length:420 start_codon:yes stop_codon:yes gene_type:complete